MFIIFLFLMLSSFVAKAESIQLIVPYGIGGPTDVVARHIEHSIEKNSNLNIAVINVSGASGNIGFKHYITKNKALIITYENIITNEKYMSSSYPKEILNQVNPLYFFTGGSFIVYGNKKFERFENLIEYSKTNTVIFGSSSPGTGSFSAMNMLCVEKAILQNCRRVIYTSGGSAIADMLSNRLDLYVSLFSSHDNFTALNTNIPLLVLSNKRFFALPNVSTSKELNIDVFIDAWIGLFHKNLNVEEINKIEKSAKQYFAINKLNQLGYDDINFDKNFFEQKKIEYASDRK